ncbi:MAG: hypothetical protein WKH47_06590 [Actinomycetes bacterium]
MSIMAGGDIAAVLGHPPCECSVDPALRSHHDRLLTVETDVAELLELLELAVTWGELDYSHAPVVRPSRWVDFARQHSWADPRRAQRIFTLAADIAARFAAIPRPAALTG